MNRHFYPLTIVRKKNQLIWVKNDENIEYFLTLRTLRTPYICVV